MKRNISNEVSSDNGVVKFLCFLAFPFFTTMYCLKHAKTKSSQLVFFMFGLLFAWSINYTNINAGIDFIEVVRSFYNFSNISLNDIVDNYLNMFESGEIRTYQLIIFGISRLFSDNYHFMYLVASIPFTICMVSSIGQLTGDKKYTNSWTCFIMLILFLLPKDFFSIQNFRYATATWMAVYATMQVAYNNDKRYLLLLFVTPLVHTSFFFYIAAFIFCFLISNVSINRILQLYFFTIPFAFLSSDLSSHLNFSILPVGLQKWVETYLSDESFATYGNLNYMDGSGSYFVPAVFSLVKTVLYVIIPVIISRRVELNSLSIKQLSLLRFFIVFFALTNIVQFVPSLGSRNFGIVRILSVFVWMKIMFPKAGNYIYFLMFSCLFELCFETIKHYGMVLDIDFYFMNVISLIYKNLNITSFV